MVVLRHLWIFERLFGFFGPCDSNNSFFVWFFSHIPYHLLPSIESIIGLQSQSTDNVTWTNNAIFCRGLRAHDARAMDMKSIPLLLIFLLFPLDFFLILHWKRISFGNFSWCALKIFNTHPYLQYTQLFNWTSYLPYPSQPIQFH